MAPYNIAPVMDKINPIIIMYFLPLTSFNIYKLYNTIILPNNILAITLNKG
jgi:hypothetical protein